MVESEDWEEDSSPEELLGRANCKVSFNALDVPLSNPIAIT